MSLNSRKLLQSFLNQKNVLLLAAVVLIGLVVYGYVMTKELARVPLYLLGKRIFISPIEMNVGEVSADESFGKTVRVTNSLASPLNIVGITASCSCVRLRETNFRIESGQSRNVEIVVDGGPSGRQFILEARLLTDEINIRSDTIRIWGNWK